MKCELRQLTVNDGADVFQMLKQIRTVENSFTNPVHDMTFDEFREWLVQQDGWNSAQNLPKGYVRQTVYWYYADGKPVGIGKIRHGLTPESRKNGGNIGYAIASDYRGKGYGTGLLEELIRKAREFSIDEILLTIDKGNYASKTVAERNGGRLTDENDERWYYSL